MFQLYAHKEPKGESKGAKGKEKIHSEEQEWDMKKRLANEVMMNIACDEIATATTDATLSGGAPQPDPYLIYHMHEHAQCPYEEYMITLRNKEVLYQARRTEPIRTYCNERYG